MKTKLKAKSINRSDAGQWINAETESKKSRKKCPKRGKRYSRAQKGEILQYVKETSVADAASKFDVTETTIYEWQRADKRRNVLEITGMINKRKSKSPRYRGSTTKLQPGTMLVTDGKEIKVDLTSSQEKCVYNWQGIVDQATCCHTAVVVTETETAEGVRRACEESARFMGRRPEALLHDNKPIHNDQKLRKAIEPETTMIPATPGRPENKAVIEGEFGKFEQAVGNINLDDSTPENLVKSAVEEVVRAYTAGINHAGRVELDGISRMQALKSACPDPEKDRAFLENLKARQDLIRKPDWLPTMDVARLILDQGFTDFQLDHLDPKGAMRTWLSSRYTPEAIRQALAIFATERDKGRLKSKTAHRYLVKVMRVV